MNLTDKEVKDILKNLRTTTPKKYTPLKIRGLRKTLKFGALSDMHMGHKCFRPDVLKHAVKTFKKENVKFILNAGDTIEGMSGRDGHIYELSHIGYSAQLDYFKEQFKLLKRWKVYSIESDDSHSGWFRSKANMGVDIGKELESHAKNYKFIGYDDQDIKFKNIKIRLTHPGGGTAYAISYKMQKYVESLGGGAKPNIIIQGHFHKASYLFYRNIHCIDAGCLEDQTLFMRKKRTPAHVGYWVVEVKCNRQGIESFKPTFYPFYD